MKIIGILFCMLTAASALKAETKVIGLPGKSPLVSLRIVFRTGSASDPADRPGLAAITASMLTQGGTRTKTYKQIVDAMYPMATQVSSQVDKEMTTFSAVTHIDNLDAFYSLFQEMLLDPGWRPDDFARIKDDHINYLRVSLRGNNDEELGKEVLYNEIYAGHPYGHENMGTVSSLQKMNIADMQQFYKSHFTRANLIVGLAGGYPDSFPKRVEKDFEKLEQGTAAPQTVRAPKPLDGWRMTMVEKQTRSVAYSIGFPIDVRRGDPDYPALLLAQSYLGQHRNSGGLLYTTMRQIRGLNYGDYAYIEYFPGGMFMFDPPPNIARHSQIFQLWIRPVEPPTAVFALRLAMFEFERFVNDGLSQEAFDRSRSFLSKYVNLLTKTKSAELGYAIDSAFYGIPDYTSYIKDGLAKLTRDDVNRAIKKHLQANNLQIAVVAQNCQDLKNKFLSGDPSPMTYNSPKPDDIKAEDKIIEQLKLPLKPATINIIQVDKVFE
jgi:zinc protease